jgi:hypothetical protein
VHDLFHEVHDDHDDHHDHHETSHIYEDADSGVSETEPLVSFFKTHGVTPKRAKSRDIVSTLRKYCCCVIPEEATRAAVAGTLAGAAVGIIGMFVPHVMFWGEAQLQNLIDKGRTPLPVFGTADEPTAGLVALGRCMIDPTDGASVRAGFCKSLHDEGNLLLVRVTHFFISYVLVAVGCSALITVAKIATTGLSLGTGIIGGHFWGPLFAGCAASHWLTDVVRWVESRFGLETGLASYPCVVILCTMGRYVSLAL